MKNYSSLPTNNQNAAKGSLISESFSIWLKSLKKKCQITTLFMWKVLMLVIWHLLFADLSQSEKLSEV